MANRSRSDNGRDKPGHIEGYICIARFATAMAASFTASGSVGCAWHVRAISSAEALIAPQLDDEMWGKPFATQYLLLDLGWKNIHSSDDHHVVGPTRDLLHSPH